MALDLHREKTLLHHGRGTRKIWRGRLISGVAAWVTILRRSISLVSPCQQLPQPCCSRWTDLASHLGKLEAMAKTQKSKNVERARKVLTVAHRERLIEELRVDPEACRRVPKCGRER